MAITYILGTAATDPERKVTGERAIVQDNTTLASVISECDSLEAKIELLITRRNALIQLLTDLDGTYGPLSITIPTAKTLQP